MNNFKIALAHEWLTNLAGSEKVLINFRNIYKDAPIYTLVHNEKEIPFEIIGKDIKTTFLQRFKKARTNHQMFLPLMPLAWEQFDLNQYDVVLSSSHSCVKGIITPPSTVHICYCHSPMRYAWEFYWEYLDRENVGKLKRFIIPLIMNYLRVWDHATASRVDYFVANSQNVARRIWKHYKRECDVIHPPVNASYFNISETNEDYYLMVGRLVAYKKVDLAVEAFNKLKLPLVVIGDGPQMNYIKSIAKDNIKLLGRQSDEVIKEHYAKCKGFVFPGEEDFGITPLEAMASGRPVIAFGKGGALETVVQDKTGMFFQQQTVESLVDAVKKFAKMSFDKSTIRKHALGFDEPVFQEKIKSYVIEKRLEHVKKIQNVGTII